MYAELERKVCTQCNVSKEKKEFGKRFSRKIGITSWCKDCHNVWRRNHKLKHIERYQEYEFGRGLRRNYGITVDQYAEMLASQKGLCGCCGQDQSKFKRKFHVDHDHTTNKIRGLLCTECNPGIGYFQESIDRLKMAITYLEKFKN